MNGEGEEIGNRRWLVDTQSHMERRLMNGVRAVCNRSPLESTMDGGLKNEKTALSHIRLYAKFLKVENFWNKRRLPGPMGFCIVEAEKGWYN